MTPQEKSMIDELVDRIRTTPVTDKDSEAEQYLRQTLGSVPEALYVLTQTVLVQQYGLTQAQAQLQARQDELDELKRHSTDSAPRSSGSFLSRIFGSDDSHSSQSPLAPAQDASGYQRVNYAPAQGSVAPPPPGAPVYGGPGYGGAVYGSGPAYGGGYGGPAYSGQPMGMPGSFGGGGGFLRGALQTAAGVAAGEMAFRGMEDLFHGFGGGESRGLAGSPGETVVNNYYDGSSGGEERRDEGRDGSSFYNPSQDASRQDPGEDKGDDSRGFGGFGNSDSDTGSQFADTGNDAGDDGSFSDSGDSDSNDLGGNGDDSGGGDDSNY